MKFTDLAEQRTASLDEIIERLDHELSRTRELRRDAYIMRYESNQDATVSSHFFSPPKSDHILQEINDQEPPELTAFYNEWSPVEDSLKALKAGNITRELYLKLEAVATSAENTPFHKGIKSLMADVEPFNPAFQQAIEIDSSHLPTL